MLRSRLSPGARKSLGVFHRWFGILLGLNLAAICLTGAFSIFGESIDNMLNPKLRTTSASQGRMITPEAALESYRKARPGIPIDRIYTPQGALQVYRLRTGAKEQPLEAFIDPYSGAFLGERDRESGFVRKVAQFHISLMWGSLGRSINGFTALASLWLLLSGLFVWWPSVRNQLKPRLTIKNPATKKRRVFDLHNVVGIYTLPILFFSVLTGFLWAFEDFTDSIFGVFGGKSRAQAPKGIASTGAARLSDGELLRISETQAPGSHLVKFMEPTAKNRIAEVHREWEDGDRFGHKILAFIDSETGKVVKTDDSRTDNAATASSRFVRPLHRGLWGGDVSRILYGLAGIAPALLFITGIIKFAYRRRSRKELEDHRATLRPDPVPEPETEVVKEPAMV
jgi:uncharacterized iron-regulated membrane protein